MKKIFLVTVGDDGLVTLWDPDCAPDDILDRLDDMTDDGWSESGTKDDILATLADCL